MTDAQLQDLADRTLRQVALKYGSSTRRDFFVIETVLADLIATGNQASSEVLGSVPSAAPKDSSSSSPITHTDDTATS